MNHGWTNCTGLDCLRRTRRSREKRRQVRTACDIHDKGDNEGGKGNREDERVRETKVLYLSKVSVGDEHGGSALLMNATRSATATQRSAIEI